MVTKQISDDPGGVVVVYNESSALVFRGQVLRAANHATPILSYRHRVVIFRLQPVFGAEHGFPSLPPAPSLFGLCLYLLRVVLAPLLLDCPNAVLA